MNILNYSIYVASVLKVLVNHGIVTPRPLELRLYHINSSQPWANFEERKVQKFTDFVKFRETIEALTDDICKTNKNIINRPIL